MNLVIDNDMETAFHPARSVSAIRALANGLEDTATSFVCQGGPLVMDDRMSHFIVGLKVLAESTAELQAAILHLHHVLTTMERSYPQPGTSDEQPE